ncbi:hypothetical protein B0H14DRAFT_3515749 [Mycena olivaceomarginata]|nr:hypothetical protein B0H14DRAFT_3515749 [Mycena olivaceomarginata]
MSSAKSGSQSLLTITNAEKSWALALAALANAWEAYAFSSVHDIDDAQVRVSTPKRETTFGGDNHAREAISLNVQTTSFLKVSTALGQAGHHARNSIPHSLPEDSRIRSEQSVDHPLELVARFLDFFGRRLMMEPKSSEVEPVDRRYG